MDNRYTAPSLTLCGEARDVLMLSTNLPGVPGGGNGEIELPPIPMSSKEEYSAPAASYQYTPDDILMDSVNDGGSTGSGSWGGSTDIEMPSIPMGR